MKNQLNNNVLNREVGFFSATVLVIANMVGTGIFTTSGFIIQELGNPYAMLVCWFVGGIFALCGALCYGELGAMFPKAGGEYVFLRESFGKCMGFLSGWISLVVGFSAPIAAAAVAFATYSFSMFSQSGESAASLSVSGIPMIALSPVTMLASGVIILLSLIHYHSLRIGTRVQNGLTLFKIALILVFITAGLMLGKGSADNFSGGSLISSVFNDKFAVSLIFVSFAYSGWNAAAYLGGEIINPGRNIPLALFAGTFLVICLYLLLNFVYIYALGAKQMSGVLEVGAKSAVSLFGANISKYFSGAIAVGILSALSAMIMTGPRVYYAMSKDGVFFELFGRVSKDRRTPAYSIFLQAGIAILLVLTASFEKLLIYIGFTLSLFTMMTVAGMMIIRIKQPLREKPYKTLGYPVTPLFFILGNLWIIYYTVKSQPVTSLYGLLTVAAGLLVFFYFGMNKKTKHEEETWQQLESQRG
jgi:APA family basic amino acid/polyamine antiporter